MIAALLVALLIADSGLHGAEPVLLPREHVIEAQEVTDEATEALTQKKHLYGVCTITFYDNGPCCCGPWAGGHTASGTVPTAGRTVASNTLPFGTRIEIEGQEYIVEDRGDSNMDAFWVDIYVDTHEEANRRGMYKSDVYIIDG